MTVLAQVGIGWMVLIFFGGGFLFFFALGKFTGGSGADLLDWDPAGRSENKRAADDEDMAQMLERSNARRRSQGLPELSEYDVVENLRGKSDNE
jgi:hypothetical protein